jgi:hypothetical protein
MLGLATAGRSSGMDERDLAIWTLVAVLLLDPQVRQLPGAPRDALAGPVRHEAMRVAELRRLRADRSALDRVARELSASVVALP